MTQSRQQHAALRQAAEWFAKLQAEDVAAFERAQWQQWINAAPEHRLAWEKIQAVSREFAILPAKPALAALNQPQARRSAVKKLLVLASTVALGTAVMRRESRDYLLAMTAGERTAVGEMRQLALADGSVLWMNTDSALDIDFAPGLRRVVLQRGEILMRSGHRPVPESGPLVVDLPGSRLTALGTRFRVHRDNSSSLLAVYEGKVSIDQVNGGSRIVEAGTQLQFNPDWIGDAKPTDEQQSAWIRKRLSVDRMRLDDFIATLARYRKGHLGCNPDIGDLLLTGSYPLDDTDRILAALEKSLPVRVDRLMPWWVTLEPVST
ncbi:DUF4880 domain-containing protein [Duganella sp. FT80W]|uniref:DUF4880 domain-containing protein n=1 Tax=Duganella guangzhouensis TaxID=2666084 RepID=A0A6I2KYY5_9BURK|nr:FecR domain-containing protein [Duganella guangzhouensis]MRW90197.1 DUF4880 domain-containing protein [Duganella guangzhouensis]